MSLSIEQQIKALVEKSSNVLICLPAQPTTDAIASGLALYHVLQKLGKKSKVVAAGFALPDNHKFLPKSDEIEHDITALRKFIISVDVSKTKVSDLAYDIKDDKLNIYVSSKNGYFEARDVATSATDYVFDLIITVDSRDLESLGKVFSDNADFFHHTPIVNMDHHPGNEQFGQINHLNVTATSISEMIFELLDHIEGDILDEYIATNLLTGIISKTKSFKTHAVTPRSLAIASHLISSGARREEIVKNLYQTKSITMLKLWGRALAKLETDADFKIVWSVLREEDFIDTETTPLDLEQVIDELIVNTPDAENVYIVYEQTNKDHEKQTYAMVSTAPYIKGLEAFKDWQAEGSENFTYLTLTNTPVEMAQTVIHQKLRSLVK